MKSVMHPNHHAKQEDTMMIIIIMFLLAFGTTNVCESTIIYTKKTPLWNWECVNEKCLPTKAIHGRKIQSLQTCNMLCASMQIWPQPTGSVSLSATAVPVRADLFQLQKIAAPNRIIREHLLDAFQIFKEDLRYLERHANGFEEWKSVALNIKVDGNGDPRMRINTNESYSLSIRPILRSGGSLVANISAPSFCGARHAMETLMQLVWLDPYVGSLLILEAAKVDDAPRFGYRGLLIDTARNYFPIQELMRNIDAMAVSKLNTLHWHLSDSQAFPLQLRSIPELAHYGAYSFVDVYNADEVRALVRRARLRGVRVILEIDVPAHVGQAWSWGPLAGLGKLVQCMEPELWSKYCNEPPCGQLNPRNKYVYDLLERLYAEIILLTGVDDMFHLGGDDVSDECWTQHYNHTDPMDLWLEFTQMALQRLEYMSGTLPNLTIIWMSRLSERFKSDLKDYVHSIALQIRKAGWAQKYVSGIRTIVSHEDAWDLNSGFGTWYDSTGGAPYNSWQRVYEYRPWARNLGGVVQGGEATVWSSVLGEGGLEARVWPRAAALAERLWTDRAEGATRPVHARLDVHRSRMLARGIHCSPLWSMWCTHNTYTCI